MTLAPRYLVHRFGFPGHHRFVDAGFAFGHFAVGGNAGARSHKDQVADLETASGSGPGRAVGQQQLGGIRHQAGQLVQRTGRLPHAAHLEPVTQQHDVNQGHQFPEEAFAETQDLRSKAVDEGDRNGETDEGHHARLAIPISGTASRKKGRPP